MIKKRTFDSNCTDKSFLLANSMFCLLRSEKTHGRVEILLTELTEFTNTSAEVKNINNRHSRKVSSKRRNSGNSFMQRSDHSNTSSGWYALEDLHSSYKIVDTNGLCASSRKDTKVRNKLNSYINILSADKPRSHIATPQLRICISVDQAL